MWFFTVTCKGMHFQNCHKVLKLRQNYFDELKSFSQQFQTVMHHLIVCFLNTARSLKLICQVSTTFAAGNFQGLFFYFRGLFFAFRGQNRPEPPCNFFPALQNCKFKGATFHNTLKIKGVHFRTLGSIRAFMALPYCKQCTNVEYKTVALIKAEDS